MNQQSLDRLMEPDHGVGAKQEKTADRPQPDTIASAVIVDAVPPDSIDQAGRRGTSGQHERGEPRTQAARLRQVEKSQGVFPQHGVPSRGVMVQRDDSGYDG